MAPAGRAGARGPPPLPALVFMGGDRYRREIVMSWLGQLDNANRAAVARRDDPWRMRLGRIRGSTGDDGLERVTTQLLLDQLEIPQHSRRAGTYRRLAKLMAELGWAAVRVRGLTRGGYLEQVRGYCRLPNQGCTRPSTARM